MFDSLMRNHAKFVVHFRSKLALAIIFSDEPKDLLLLFRRIEDIIRQFARIERSVPPAQTQAEIL